MGNKPSITQNFKKRYDNLNLDSHESKSSTDILPSNILSHAHQHHQSIPSINSTHTSSSDLYRLHHHQISYTFSQSRSHDSYESMSIGQYPDLPPLQERFDIYDTTKKSHELIFHIVMYADISTRLQLSLCCSFFYKLIISTKYLHDVWIIHGLTHNRRLWEIPLPHTRYYRSHHHSHHHIHHHHHQHSSSSYPPILPRKISPIVQTTSPRSILNSRLSVSGRTINQSNTRNTNKIKIASVKNTNVDSGRTDDIFSMDMLSDAGKLQYSSSVPYSISERDDNYQNQPKNYDRLHTRAASFAGGSTYAEETKNRNKKILKTRKFGGKFTKDDNYFRKHRNRKISVLKSLPKSLPPEKIFGGFQELQQNLVVGGKNKSKNKNIVVGKTVNIVGGKTVGDIKEESMTPMNIQLSRSHSKSEDSLFIGKNLVISTNNYGNVIIHKNTNSTIGSVVGGINGKNMKNYNNVNLMTNMPIRLPSQSSLSSVSSSRPLKDSWSSSPDINISLQNYQNAAQIKDRNIINNKYNKSVRYYKSRSRKYSRLRVSQRLYPELYEYNIVVADFKKYLLQFSPIIKHARCLVVGADGLPGTLRDFSKLGWVPMVMNVSFLVLERCNVEIAAEIVHNFSHSLEYLSMRGEVDETFDFNYLNIYVLRICMNMNQMYCQHIWTMFPYTIKYLCLYKCSFAANLLNESLSNCRKLLHISLIDCKWNLIKPMTKTENNYYVYNTNMNKFAINKFGVKKCILNVNNKVMAGISEKDLTVMLPSTLISLHLKNIYGDICLEKCRFLAQIVLHIDMKGYNVRRTNGNLDSFSNVNNSSSKMNANSINISQLMTSLEICQKTEEKNLKQIVFYEYNNFDKLVEPSVLIFEEWKSCSNLSVVIPEHWLSNEIFCGKFENAKYTDIKYDIFLDENIVRDIKDDDVDEEVKMSEEEVEDGESSAIWNSKEREYRKCLRDRIGCSMFGDVGGYHNTHIGEFNLAKYVRNGFHQIRNRHNLNLPKHLH